MTAENLKPLTAMRFFAALWVVIYAWWGVSDFGTAPALVAKGYLGVDLFFVLSGFILCHVYLQQAGERRFRYGSFLWNRLARVYPLHIATLVGVGLLAGAAMLMGMHVNGNVLSWETLPANLLMVHAWGVTETAGWNHPSWSISAEWFAYLTFPIFAAAAWALRKRPIAATLLAVGVLFGAYAGYRALTGELLTQATFAGGAIRIVPAFAYGCAAYLAWKADWLKDVRVTWGVLAAALFGIGLAAGLKAPDAVIVTLFGPLIVALAAVGARGESPLGAKPFVYLGEVSYSVYMVCIPWQLASVNLMQKITGSEQLPAWAWIALIACIPAIAAGSYHLVEKPARAWMKAFAARRGREAASPQIA